MTETDNKSNTNINNTITTRIQDKKPYSKPQLINYGKLKDITLAGSPGTGDTANISLERP